MMASRPVMLKWLVGVNGCQPGTTASGSRPSRFATRMKVKSEKTNGVNF